MAGGLLMNLIKSPYLRWLMARFWHRVTPLKSCETSGVSARGSAECRYRVNAYAACATFVAISYKAYKALTYKTQSYTLQASKNNSGVMAPQVQRLFRCLVKALQLHRLDRIAARIHSQSHSASLVFDLRQWELLQNM